MHTKKSVIYFLFLFFSNEFLSDSVDKVTYASWNKPDVEILYVLPKEINENTKVLFIIHGNSRDVKKYLNQWIEPSKDKNVILVAPYFDKISYPNFNTLQMATSSGKILFFNAIDSVHFSSSLSVSQLDNCRSVATQPGKIELTLMFCSPNSLESALVMPINPALGDIASQMLQTNECIDRTKINNSTLSTWFHYFINGL